LKYTKKEERERKKGREREKEREREEKKREEKKRKEKKEKRESRPERSLENSLLVLTLGGSSYDSPSIIQSCHLPEVISVHMDFLAL
jgi:hypothetical protein